jgi:predicted ABC-type ATPase
MYLAFFVALFVNCVWFCRALNKPSPEGFCFIDNLCSLEDQISKLCGTAQSKMIFTAGVPGAGKTYVLHQLRTLGNLTLLDLDTAIMEHATYDPKKPEAAYQTIAYEWANEQVETMFHDVLANPADHKLVAFDGTGTKVGRSIRRMQAAKSAGFTVVLLYVRVQLSTALRRNAQRHRRVPEDVMKQYLDALDRAVEQERAEADEYIEFNNDAQDADLGLKLWQSHFDRVWGQLVVYDELRSLLGKEKAQVCYPGEAVTILGGRRRASAEFGRCDGDVDPTPTPHQLRLDHEELLEAASN